jgi:Fe-S-cluster-containing hydrogenase component 2
MDKSNSRKELYGNHVVQYAPEYSFCSGCTSCEIVCSLVHDGLVSPSYNRIYVDRGTSTMVHRIRACLHCNDHPCYDACPKKDKAMCIDENNIVYIVEDECTGCGLCSKACRLKPSAINMVKSRDKSKRKAKKCDLCRTRPEGPACVEFCPVRCIGLSEESQQIPLDAAGIINRMEDHHGK